MATAGGGRSGEAAGRMTEFLLELYVPRSDGAAAERDAERARRGAEELTGEGTPVRYVRSIFLPEDETCFYLYEAASADNVREAARRSELSYERIAEVAPRVRDPTEK